MHKHIQICICAKIGKCPRGSTLWAGKIDNFLPKVTEIVKLMQDFRIRQQFNLQLINTSFDLQLLSKCTPKLTEQLPTKGLARDNDQTIKMHFATKCFLCSSTDSHKVSLVLVFSSYSQGTVKALA